MKNNELMNLSNSFRLIADAHFSKESGVSLSNKVFYALRKNVRSIAPIFKESDGIKSDLQELFKKNENVDEDKLHTDEEYLKEVNAKFMKFVEVPENIEHQKRFLEEGSPIELFKVSTSDLDECIMPISDSEFLEAYMV